MKFARSFHWMCLAMVLPTVTWADDEVELLLRSQVEKQPGSEEYYQELRPTKWSAKQTAVIICDVWDLHHSLNAVRRVEEFAPRLNEFVKNARRRGMTVIHSPSDCMAAYENHPARLRAMQAPPAANLPDDIRSWCSRIPAEELAVYPIDQSDGGDDDEPGEHAVWAAKLKDMGRNPGTPWLAQSKLIEIEEDHDFISDRGDEIWNVLEQRGIQNVILTGVHLNMCVLGRPFGLRQMARNGKHVVLVRDMTDTMYNPARWPYVSHFEGTRLMVAHVERHVCPTITSDQLLGGDPFRFQGDLTSHTAAVPPETLRSFTKHWTLGKLPDKVPAQHDGVIWYRCALRLRDPWIDPDGVAIEVPAVNANLQAWFNGHELLRKANEAGGGTYAIDSSTIAVNDANLLVLRMDSAKAGERVWPSAPRVASGSRHLELAGRWQFRIGDDRSWSNIPLPARYGVSPDIVFEP